MCSGLRRSNGGGRRVAGVHRAAQASVFICAEGQGRGRALMIAILKPAMHWSADIHMRAFSI